MCHMLAQQQSPLTRKSTGASVYIFIPFLFKEVPIRIFANMASSLNSVSFLTSSLLFSSLF